MMARIFADFNSRTFDDKGERIHIGREGSWQIDEYPQKLLLKPGSPAKLSDGELEVHAVLEFDESSRIWYGRPDWSTKRQLESRADGLEEYKAADATLKLNILRYETGPLLAAIEGYADVLVRAHQTTASQVSPDQARLTVNNLAELIKDLARIIDSLTDVTL